MTTLIDNSLVKIERQKRTKIAGTFRNMFSQIGEMNCTWMQNGGPDKCLAIFKGDQDIEAGDRLVSPNGIYDISRIQKHEMDMSPETVAVCSRNEFESGFKKLSDLGCNVGYGQVMSIHKDDEAEQYMDAWVGTFIQNIVAHYDEIKNGRHIGEFYGLFNHDIPAVCVGAGPSLDKNVNLLKDFPGIIICTDKAYKMIRARNIEPDIVISIDCHYDLVAAMLDCPGNERHKLVLNTCSDPKINLTWEGLVFWFNMKHPGVQFTDKILPALFPTFHTIENLGNVGNAAVAFADHMGCSPIALIGYDYGYTGNRMNAQKYEFNGTEEPVLVHEDHEDLIQKRSGKVEIDGVTTYLPYKMYRDSLYMLKFQRGINIINCTEGGILNSLPKKRFSEMIDHLQMTERDAYKGARQKLNSI